MENVSQYTFELKELSEMLLKQKGIKEGLWDIGVNFKMAALLAGPDEASSRPTMMVSIDSLLLTRVKEVTPMTVDASTLGP